MNTKKALTFRASSIGDSLMGKYFLENIRAADSTTRCAIVVSGRASLIRDLFAAYPWLEVLEVNRRHPSAVMSLVKEWSSSDGVLTQYAGKAGGSFSLASKIVGRVLARRGRFIGFSDSFPFNGLLYDRIIPLDRAAAPAVLERMALRELAVPVSVPYPTLAFAPQPDLLKRFSVSPGSFIVVHLTAGYATRSMSPERQHDLLQELHRHFPEKTLLLSGGSTDRLMATQVGKDISTARVIAGEVTLQEMMQFISEATGVISVDTGMAHITAQLGRPLIVIGSCLGLHWWKSEQYGPAASVVVLSHSESCAHGHVHENYPPCLNDVDMNVVAKKASSLFV